MKKLGFYIFRTSNKAQSTFEYFLLFSTVVIMCLPFLQSNFFNQIKASLDTYFINCVSEIAGETPTPGSHNDIPWDPDALFSDADKDAGKETKGETLGATDVWTGSISEQYQGSIKKNSR